MGNNRPDRVLLWVAALVAFTAFLDAIIIEEYDLAVLAGVILGLLGLLLLRSRTRRRAVMIRPDLARWAQEVSDVTGEPTQQIVDRALASYRLQQGSEGVKNESGG